MKPLHDPGNSSSLDGLPLRNGHPGCPACLLDGQAARLAGRTDQIAEELSPDLAFAGGAGRAGEGFRKQRTHRLITPERAFCQQVPGNRLTPMSMEPEKLPAKGPTWQ